MRFLILFSVVFFSWVNSYSQVTSAKKNCDPDTVYYTAVKSRLLINKNHKDSLNHWGKNKLKADKTNSVSVAQAYINYDSIKVHGAVIHMGAYNSLSGNYTPVDSPVKVTVYLYNVNQDTYQPTTKIDSVEIEVLHDSMYTAIFPSFRTITDDFAIGLKNTTYTTPISTSRIKVFANNAMDTTYGENMGFVQAPLNSKNGIWQANSDYFDGFKASSTTPYGYETGLPSDSLINWDWMIHPIISYTVKASLLPSSSNPGNQDNVEISRMSKLRIGKNHMLSWSGFKFKFLKEKDSSFYWVSDNTIKLDSVYKFTMLSTFKGVELKAHIQGYSSNCADSYSIFLAGISELNDLSNINVFPNPASNSLTVNIDKVISGVSMIKIVDISGKTLIEKSISRLDSSSEHVFDIERLVSGMYFVKIENENAMHSMKFIKN